MKKLQKSEIQKIIHDFCKKYKIKYRYQPLRRGIGGLAYLENNLIKVNSRPNLTKAQLYSTLHHEYYHIWCLKNHKYPAYHGICTKKILKMSKKQIRNAINSGYKAECYVDLLASKAMGRELPRLTFNWSYLPKNESMKRLYWESHKDITDWLNA